MLNPVEFTSSLRLVRFLIFNGLWLGINHGRDRPFLSTLYRLFETRADCKLSWHIKNISALFPLSFWIQTVIDKIIIIVNSWVSFSRIRWHYFPVRVTLRTAKPRAVNLCRHLNWFHIVQSFNTEFTALFGCKIDFVVSFDGICYHRILFILKLLEGIKDVRNFDSFEIDLWLLFTFGRRNCHRLIHLGIPISQSCLPVFCQIVY